MLAPDRSPHRCHPRPWLIALLCAVAWVLPGCHGGVGVPAGWSQQTWTAQAASAESGQLQVIICYGSLLSNHAAVRLACAENGPLFWDPGGGYLENADDVQRRASVVLHPVPTLETYWHWRRDACSEPMMAVFEFDLSRAEAVELYEALVAGADGRASERSFTTERLGGECALAVSDFLEQFQAERVPIGRRYFWPHDLADALWSCEPDRVHVFRRGERASTYHPAPSRIAGDSPGGAGG